MTDDTRLCPACGTPNSSRDEFCGSCGAALAAGGTAQATSASSGGADVRCPACGTANPAARTFCQSCGNRLAAPARPAAAGPSGASPMASPTGSSHAASTRAPAASGQGSGARGWLVVAGLGLVAGIAIVVASIALQSPGPPSGAVDASPTPSLSISPEAAPS